jgi:hypothetical protein
LLDVPFVSTTHNQDLNAPREAEVADSVVAVEVDVVVDSVVVAVGEEAVVVSVIVVDVGVLEVVAEAAQTVVASETSKARSKHFNSRHDVDCMPVDIAAQSFIA